MCLAAECGHGEEYENVELTEKQMRTSLQPRLRQHLRRRHQMGLKHPTAERLRHRAKQLLCRRLHEQPTNTEDQPSGLDAEVFFLSA